MEENKKIVEEVEVTEEVTEVNEETEIVKAEKPGFGDKLVGFATKNVAKLNKVGKWAKRILKGIFVLSGVGALVLIGKAIYDKSGKQVGVVNDDGEPELWIDPEEIQPVDVEGSTDTE